MILPFPFPLGTYGPENTNEVFPITLRFDVKARHIRLEVSKMLIRFSDGSEHRPIGYKTRREAAFGFATMKEPDKRCAFHDYFGATARDVAVAIPNADAAAVTVEPEECLDLFFPGPPPDPAREYVLIIGDVLRDGAIIRVPVIRFVKGSIMPGW